MQATLLCANANETLTEQCQAVIRSLLSTRHPPPGIAVFSPRKSPSVRYTSRLKCFNQSFLDLCDTVAFPDLRPTCVWPQSANFLYLDTAHAARSTWEHLVETIDKIHTGELTRASLVFLHISHTGRKRVVRAEVFAFTERGSLVEFLIVETLLPDDFLVVEPRSMPLSYIRAQPSCLVATVPTKEALRLAPPVVDLQWELITVQENSLKKQQIDQACFTCSECGASRTSQKRRGPMGDRTLCNRCGLKWQQKARMCAGVEQ